MTQEELKNHAFSAWTRVKYKGKVYLVLSVDFEECLICLYRFYVDDDDRWVRCENCELETDKHKLI